MNISIVTRERRLCNFCGSDNLLFISEQNSIKIECCGICGNRIEKEDNNTILCPVCGKKTIAKAYGPFFTPDPVYRSAMTCPDDHWRGTMFATHQEAEKNYDK